MSSGMLNCCRLRMLKAEYEEKLIYYRGSYYLVGEQPIRGQGAPQELPDGTPIQFVAWFMEVGECEYCRMARLQQEEQQARKPITSSILEDRDSAGFPADYI